MPESSATTIASSPSIQETVRRRGTGLRGVGAVDPADAGPPEQRGDDGRQPDERDRTTSRAAGTRAAGSPGPRRRGRARRRRRRGRDRRAPPARRQAHGDGARIAPGVARPQARDLHARIVGPFRPFGTGGRSAGCDAGNWPPQARILRYRCARPAPPSTGGACPRTVSPHSSAGHVPVTRPQHPRNPMSMPPRSRTGSGPLVAGLIILVAVVAALVVARGRRDHAPARLGQLLPGRRPDAGHGPAVATRAALQHRVLHRGRDLHPRRGPDRVHGVPLPPQAGRRRPAAPDPRQQPGRGDLDRDPHRDRPVPVRAVLADAQHGRGERRRATSTSAPSRPASSGGSTTWTARRPDAVLFTQALPAGEDGGLVLPVGRAGPR